jgi:hypothetical protein
MSETQNRAGGNCPLPEKCNVREIHKLQLVPSDFGIEIGGQPSFDNLPRSLPPHNRKLAGRLCAACHTCRRLPSEIAQLKHQAFCCSHKAKTAPTRELREAFYRRKDTAINRLLNLGWAFVHRVEWWHDDALIVVRFVGRGKLHIPMSRVDASAFREVRAQLNGQTQPSRATLDLESGEEQHD